MEKIGLIAGNRKFPLLLSESARRKGYYVAAVAIKRDTSPLIARYANKVYWLGLDEFSKMFSVFKKEGIAKVVMAGQISPKRLFSREVEKDPELRALLAGIKDRRADTIFGAIAEKLKAAGLELLDSTEFVFEHLPQKGVLTRREPSFEEWEDIYFGLDLAKAIAYLDIGQTVCVKGRAIVAVEAMEGTDNLIRRSGSIARGGATLVKVSKPKQDLRFDVPVVGLRTIRNMVNSRMRCLAIEAGKTLFIDRQASTRLADRAGMAIVAV